MFLRIDQIAILILIDIWEQENNPALEENVQND